MSDTSKVFEAYEMVAAKKIELIQSLPTLDKEFMATWEKDCMEHYEEDGQAVFLAELSELINQVEFLFDRLDPEEEGGAVKYQIKLGLTKCPWPKLELEKKRRKKIYHAPESELANISFYELCMTFTIFEDFVKTGKPEKADELIATLYRPSKPKTKHNVRSGYEGDRRLPLLKHESMVKKRTKRMSQLPNPVKQLIIFWFASCRKQIIDSFPNIFSAPEKHGEKVGNDYGWGGVLMALAGGIIHLDTVAQQPHMNALAYLSYLEDQRKLQEIARLQNKAV